MRDLSTSPFWVPACPRLWVLSPRIRPSSSRTRPCPKTRFMMVTIKRRFLVQILYQNSFLSDCSKTLSLYRTPLSKQCSGFVTLWDGSGIRILGSVYCITNQDLDPDPILLFSSLAQDTNKKSFFLVLSFSSVASRYRTNKKSFFFKS